MSRQPVLDGSQEEIAASLGMATARSKGRGGKRVFTVQEAKGLMVYNYGEGFARHFEEKTGVRGGEAARVEASLRKECRGLVVGPHGVVSRPMHKFFEEGQTSDTRHGQVAQDVVQDARKKMDGSMVFGVVHPTEGWTELWTRAGPEGLGKWATRFAEGGSAGDVLGLVEVLDGQGYTACFEWVGRQAKVKEKHEETELVLTQVRHKVSGKYMEWAQMRGVADRHGVKCTDWAAELVGLTVEAASAKVRTMQGVEGFVVLTRGGCMLKLKTWWWHDKGVHKYRRWHSDDQKQAEWNRRQRKQEMMQVQGCRAVVQGWARGLSPALVLDKVHGAVKAEEFCSRRSGNRGAIVLSFASPEERNVAIEKVEFGGVKLFPAYSSRSSSNTYHRIRTYWSDGGRRTGG